MGPGLPGVGLAALFYVALALLAPFRELVLTVLGRSSLERWRSVGIQFGLGLGVAGSVIGLYLVANALLSQGFLPHQETSLSARRLPNLAYILIALAGVLLVSWAYAGWIRFTVRTQDPETIATAHGESSIPTPMPTHRSAQWRGRHAGSRDLLNEMPRGGDLFPWRDSSKGTE